MKTDAWGHQHEAAKFCEERRGSVLEMAMGTGKSRVVVDLHERWAPKLTVIVCPKRVMRVWPKQFEIHADVVPVIVTLDKGTSAKKVERCRREGVLVVNYEAIWREPLASWMRAADISLLVCDEVHRAKSPTGKASKFLRLLAAQAGRVLGLSGTLLPHSPLDAWAIGMIIDPAVLGRSFVVHRNTYAVIQKVMMGGKERPLIKGFRNLLLLGERLSEFAYHAGEEVLDLPEAMHEVVEVDLCPKAMKIYAPLHAGFAAECAAGVINLANAAVKFTRLQQLTGGWAAVDADTGERVDYAKRDALRELLEDMDPEESVVVFCRFRQDLNMVHEAAEAAGREHCELSGTNDELGWWEDDEPGSVLAAQIQSGGTGVDLTKARYTVFFSVGSLANYLQALKRTHRPGQERPVTYYHLVVANSIDEDIYDALANRREVIDSVIDSLKGKQ